MCLFRVDKIDYNSSLCKTNNDEESTLNVPLSIELWIDIPQCSELAL